VHGSLALADLAEQRFLSLVCHKCATEHPRLARSAEPHRLVGMGPSSTDGLEPEKRVSGTATANGVAGGAHARVSDAVRWSIPCGTGARRSRASLLRSEPRLIDRRVLGSGNGLEYPQRRLPRLLGRASDQLPARSAGNAVELAAAVGAASLSAFLADFTSDGI